MISLEIQHIASLVSIMKCGILYPYIHYMIRTYQILFETMMIEMKVAASLAEHSRLFLKDDVHLWYHTFRDHSLFSCLVDTSHNHNLRR